MAERYEAELKPVDLKVFLQNLAGRADEIIKVDIRRLRSGKAKIKINFTSPGEKQFPDRPLSRKLRNKELIGNI